MYSIFILDINDNDNSSKWQWCTFLFGDYFFFLYRVYCICSPSSVFISFSIHVINFLFVISTPKIIICSNKFASYVSFLLHLQKMWTNVLERSTSITHTHTCVYCKIFSIHSKARIPFEFIEIDIFVNFIFSRNTTKK